jgi:hypothetical protein
MAEYEPTRAMEKAPPAGSPPAAEQTIMMQPAAVPPTGSAAGGDPLQDPAKRRQVEAELLKLGMSTDEVRRIIAARADSVDPPPAAARIPAPPPMPIAAPPKGKRKSPRVDADSLSSFASELMAQRSMETNRAVEAAASQFPAFRECTAQERQAADAALREANAFRRREKYREAEEKCRLAILHAPKDAAALELLGDILQGVARTDEALAAYKRAMEADARRSSAETKYGDLLMRQQNWGGIDGEAVDKNPWYAVLLSAAFPGAGQFHNGEIAKGVFYVVLDLLCVWLLGWSPWGFSSELHHHGINMGLIACSVFASVVYLSAMFDANAVARGTKRRGGASGWDV